MKTQRTVPRTYVLIPVIAAAMATAAIVAFTADSERWEQTWNSRQPPDRVMDAVGIEPGMVVAEIGAGKGRYAVQVAARVGPEGKVYAEDIDADALDYVEFRCQRDTIDNIETIVGEATDPLLPANSCDFVYCINTYHHIDRPILLMRNIASALKPSGRLMVIEHTPKKVEPKGFEGHCTPADTVMAQAVAAGFALEVRHSFLEYDEIYVFKAITRSAEKD